MKKSKPRKIKVVHRKLGREQADGQAFIGDDLIEIDSRLTGKEHLRTAVHELVHIEFPEASETKVLEAERIIGNTLWELGYRKINE